MKSPSESKDSPQKENVPSSHTALTVVDTDLLENLQKQSTEIHQLQDRLLRTQADWDNYRKRVQREKEEAVKYAAESLFEKLLPILDHFETGIEAAKKTSDPHAIAQGMEIILNQLKALLKEAGVEPVDALGQAFDPHRHEALGHHETTEHAEGTVIKQMRKGYQLKDRLLRPASVFVAKNPHS
jgi:molecular chaperone GrpE